MATEDADAAQGIIEPNDDVLRNLLASLMTTIHRSRGQRYLMLDVLAVVQLCGFATAMFCVVAL